MTYYNTTNEIGRTLAEAEETNLKLETRLLNLFEQQSEWRPSQLFNYYTGRFPITSIRRALTDLTEIGSLEKTDVRLKGMYGRNEHVWRVKD